MNSVEIIFGHQIKQKYSIYRSFHILFLFFFFFIKFI